MVKVMTLFEKLEKKFDKLAKKLESFSKSTTFESIENWGGVKVAQSNGHLEIEGEVKSLKVNGKKVKL